MHWKHFNHFFLFDDHSIKEKSKLASIVEKENIMSTYPKFFCFKIEKDIPVRSCNQKRKNCNFRCIIILLVDDNLTESPSL